VYCRFLSSTGAALELIKTVVGASERSRSTRPPLESALRHLGTVRHGKPVDLLTHAIDRPYSVTGKALAPLVAATAALDDWSAAERARALWRVVVEGIRDPDVGPTPLSRPRRALHAALRIPDEDIHQPWGASLTERFKQLRALREVFNDATTTQPMEMAWKRGVAALATVLEERLSNLRTVEDWQHYLPRTGLPHAAMPGPDAWHVYIDELDGTDAVFRTPSRGAQPVFVNLFVTTVFMKRRAVFRRITERLITARADGVEYYTARGFAGKTSGPTYVPVRALWGCEARFIEPSQAGRPAVTHLWFPKSLRMGEQAHFASEIIDENITAERDWVDVDVDHHGISRGRLLYGDRIPVSGLTIRVRFDEGCLPEAVWWYAEMNENERYDQPPPGDRHLLTVVGNDVQHTFTDQVCQPRESYGLSFKWPQVTD
jgi:hypothetical protein